MATIFDHRYEGNIPEIRRLLGQNIDVNQRNQHGQNLLHIAVVWCPEIVPELLQYGANIASKNVDGETVLHRAVANGYFDMVHLLIISGANINANINAKTRTGETPLHMASIRDSKDIIVELLKHGANANAQDKLGRTPFHMTIQLGCNENAKLLIEYTDLSLKDINGETALEVAHSEEMKELINEYLNVPDIKEPV